MIEVPVAVKEALKDGRRKKNYIIDVVDYNFDDPEDLNDWDVISTFYTNRELMGGRWYNYIYMFYPCRVKAVGPDGIPIAFRITYNGETKYLGFTGTSESIEIKGGSYLYFEADDYGIPITVHYINEKSYIITDSFDNNNLLTESVKIDERLCSQKNITYGLCEGSSIEFKYFGKDSIKGKIIKVALDVYYDEENVHRIPLGYYYVTQCSRQVSTNIYNVLAYDRLGLEEVNGDIELSKMPVDPSAPSKVSVNTIAAAIMWDMGARQSGYYPIYVDEPVSTGDTTFTGLTYTYDGRTYTVHVTGKYLEWTYSGSSDYIRNYRIININEYMSALRICLDEIEKYMFDRDVNLFNDFVANSKFDEMCGLTITATNGTKTSYTLAEYEKANGPLREPFDVTNVKKIKVCLPLIVVGKASSYTDEISELSLDYVYHNQDDVQYELEISETEIDDEIYSILISKDEKINMRQFLAGLFEINAQFGYIDKTDNAITGKYLQSRDFLYPANNLYPDNALYPGGHHFSAYPVNYSQLWVDGENSINRLKSIGIYYKALQNSNEVLLFKDYVINFDGNYDYICADNYFFTNYILSIDFVTSIIYRMAYYMAKEWLSYEAWCPGLPYLETGDAIEIPIDEERYTGYILQRQLQGIQNLQDTFISGEVDLY